MARRLQIRSLGRFLYTQNPFYLISCFLIIYGLQIATLAQGDLYTRSIFLTASIAGYLLLMALTCIGVVRLGKVWEDARSIFLVVIISQVALSSGLDEHCIYHWRSAACLLLLGAAFSLLVTELVVRSCRLRFPCWYRLAYYVLMSIFFLMPIGLGSAVIHRYTSLANWGAPLYSTLIAAGLLLLVPAVRRADTILGGNAAPWRWPYYPLTAFAILVVLAGIRTHAIWMSFGYLGAPVRFEPFLLLPIILAILILVVEANGQLRSSSRTYTTMALAPAMLLCGVTRGGMTHLPIEADLQAYCGSAHTVSLLALAAFYLWVWIRGARGSAYALTATLLALGVISDLPALAEAAGFRHWMFASAASLVTLTICLRHPRSESRWLVFTGVTTFTILMWGQQYDAKMASLIGASVFILLSLMTIGALFDTELAEALRFVAAALLISGSVLLMAWHYKETPGAISSLALLGLSAMAIVYAQIVKRSGWLVVFGFELACLFGVLGWDGYREGAFEQTNWPIQSGLICFAIGLTITSMKTGVHHRLLRRLPDRTRLAIYRSGL